MTLREPIEPALRPWVALALPVILAALWCAVSATEGARAFLPSPAEVMRGLVQLTFDYGLLQALWTSTRRILTAFTLAAALALPLGIAMGSFDLVRRLFEPVLAPLRFMPIVAFIPVLVLWFGIDEGQKVAFLFLGVFVYLVPVVVEAVASVPQAYVDTARTLGASHAQVVRTVFIPAALPAIVESFRVMNAILWTYVTLAEVVNPGRSLGYIIQLAYTHSKPAWSFAGLVVIGGVGLVTDAALRTAHRLAFRWKE